MDWQFALTCLAVVLAGAFIARRCWLTLRGTKSGCGGGCCDKPKATEQSGALIPVEQLVMRQRKTS